MEKRRVGPEVRRLNNMIKRTVESSTVKLQLDRLTGLHGWIVGYIARTDGPVFQRDLEERFSVRRSTMSNIMSLMEHNGLIVRQSYEGDKRLKQIVLTDYALGFDKTAREDMDRMELMLTNGISEEELDNFFNTVDKIKANIDREEKND